MITKELVIENGTGLHARPATLVAKKAAQFKSEVNIKVGEKTINAKSLIAILSLGAKKGTELQIITTGVDEELAAAEMAALIKGIEE